MEYINRIEVQGRIGTLRVNEVNGSKVANFSIATEHLYKTRDSGAVNETTWHNIVAWSGRDIPDPERFSKGMPVNVVGRLRTSKYMSADGTEKQFYEIMASKVRIVSDEEEIS